jgi:hypothetical protein
MIEIGFNTDAAPLLVSNVMSNTASCPDANTNIVVIAPTHSDAALTFCKTPPGGVALLDQA